MPRDLLSPVLSNPSRVEGYELKDWDLLIRQARHADLLGRLLILLEENGLRDAVPEPALPHLLAARTVTGRHAILVRYEISQIYRALWRIGVPIIALKGAAYVMADLPAAAGRLFFDIDILVPKPALPQVEGRLRRHGWVATHLDEYDQKYYRKWMHELPPLKHVKRRTVLDVHHRILPETARLKPAPEKMLASAEPVKGYDDLYVLAPEDMVLHSATHLFHDGELEHGLRDLTDLDSLLRHFNAAPGFWPKLDNRARELELGRPLYYGLRYCSRILGTPIPEQIIENSQRFRPLGPLRFFMDFLFQRGLKSDHASCQDRFTGLARRLLYVRSHYLRMPLYLLLPHLFHKAFITPYTERRAEKRAAERPNLQRLLAQKRGTR